jgi:hypothetical protein
VSRFIPQFLTACLSALLFAGCASRQDAGVPPSSPLAARDRETPLAGEDSWGISCLSVASAREHPDHKAEMGTQVLMGQVVRLLGKNTNGMWYHVQTEDGYLAWLEKGTFVRCSREGVESWQRAPLLVVTALESQVVERPTAEADPVSDLVIADLARKRGEKGDWYEVELPDGRSGFLPRSAAAEFESWSKARQPTARNIERAGRRFLGRPYLWGGNSPK